MATALIKMDTRAGHTHPVDHPLLFQNRNFRFPYYQIVTFENSKKLYARTKVIILTFCCQVCYHLTSSKVLIQIAFQHWKMGMFAFLSRYGGFPGSCAVSRKINTQSK